VRQLPSIANDIVKYAERDLMIFSTSILVQDEQWQVRNVIFDGVNLGLTMRSQFATSVSTLGRVEQAVARWEIDDSE
jgi:ABC-type transporter MlaC component